MARLVVSVLQTQHLLRQEVYKKRAVEEAIQSAIGTRNDHLMPYLSILNSILNINFVVTDAAALALGAQRTELVHELLSTVLDQLVHISPKASEDAKQGVTMLVINVRRSVRNRF